MEYTFLTTKDIYDSDNTCHGLEMIHVHHAVNDYKSMMREYTAAVDSHDTALCNTLNARHLGEDVEHLLIRLKEVEDMNKQTKQNIDEFVDKLNILTRIAFN